MKKQATLTHLRNIVFSMGKSALTSVNLIVEAIEMTDIDSLKMVEILEVELDNCQMDLDALCYDLIKKRQLNKDELKVVWIYIKSGEWLERIGDLCFNITRHLRKIMEFKESIFEINELISLAKMIKVLIDNSVRALVDEDVEQARDVIQKEKRYDPVKEMILKSSMEVVKTRKDYIPISLSVIFITRNLERIGELSRNIAEGTLFYLEDLYLLHQDENVQLESFLA